LGQKLLLQNLYLRAASQAALLPQASYLMDVSGDDVSVWLEGVTFQGTARRGQDDAWMGVLVMGLGMARIHAEGAPRCICFRTASQMHNVKGPAFHFLAATSPIKVYVRHSGLVSARCFCHLQLPERWLPQVRLWTTSCHEPCSSKLGCD
jgi:hypothetical protein